MSFDPKKLHDSISPSESGTYGDLISVAQAFPIGILIWALVDGSNSVTCSGGECVHDAGGSTPVKIIPGAVEKLITSGEISFGAIWLTLRVILIICIIAVVWHRYVKDGKLVAWHLDWLDTAIPFLTAILQSVVAFSVISPNVWFFSCVSLVSTAGAFSYWQFTARQNSPYARSMYLRHFEDETTTKIVHGVVRKYLIRGTRICGGCTMCMFVAIAIIPKMINVLIVACSCGPDDLAPILMFTVSFATIAILFKDDLARRILTAVHFDKDDGRNLHGAWQEILRPSGNRALRGAETLPHNDRAGRRSFP